VQNSKTFAHCCCGAPLKGFENRRCVKLRPSITFAITIASCSRIAADGAEAFPPYFIRNYSVAGIE
jgi:hypothetical protein